jgi:hypothetical protein
MIKNLQFEYILMSKWYEVEQAQAKRKLKKMLPKMLI